MKICVDIGNSNAVIGLWHNGWHQIWRIVTKTDDRNAFKLEIAERWIETGFHASDVELIIISSVVPALTEPYQSFFRGMCEAPVVVIGPEIYQYLPFPVHRPYEIGTDLVSNAVGALQLYQSDCLIVDFGTALTFLLVNTEQGVIGASIAPGIESAFRTLRDETAQLPQVRIVVPEQVAGRNTVEAIQSGIVIGYEGLILHLISKYKEWHASPLKTVATGGLINVLTGFHPHFDVVNPTLTLDGMLVIGDLVRKKTSIR